MDHLTTHWVQTFFSGLMLETLPWMASDEQTSAEAAFLVKTLAPLPGARIVDVPSGDGRLALALAAQGYDVTGVDLTPEFVEEARLAAEERSLPATFHERDMRDLPWPGEFDHAFCFGNSFGYFDDAGNKAFLQAMHDILKPNGRFVLETGLAAESIFAKPLQRRWYPCGNMYFLHETQYDPAAGQLTSSYTLIREAQVERKQAVYRVYTFRELAQMFRDVGFSGVVGYGSLQQEPYQLGSAGLWLVATKG